jgi:HEAT repeat protein
MKKEIGLAAVTAGDLAPWRETDEILQALGGVQKNEVEHLAEALALLLEHEDADVRDEAARALFVAGKNTEHRTHAVELLRHDPEVAVRCTAAYGVASTSTPATRQADVELLAGVVRDDNEHVEARRSAYEALLILFRRPTFPAMNRPFNPGQDVDWKWLAGLKARPDASGDT